MKNTYEVRITPDDNNNSRLPGTVNPEAQRGDSAYGPGKNNFIKNTNLDAADTAGVIGKPTIGGDYVPTPMKNSSVTGPTGVVETTYNHANLSAKYKYPNISQDVPPKGNPNTQYNDHT